MANMTSLTPAATFESLLKVGTANNQNVDGTLRVVEDGTGVASALYLSTGAVKVASGASGATASANGDELVIDGATGGKVGMSILSGDASGDRSTIFFGSASDNIGALIQWEYNAQLMTIGTNNSGDSVRFNSGDGVACMTLDSDQKVGIGLTPTANMVGLSIEAGCITLKERATPTADTNYGKIYTKTDNKLYFQDGAGTEHEISFA
tara:strand:- start:58 stop:681 length:624 start_codon:yes stop_codon:yes gene_type:complete